MLMLDWLVARLKPEAPIQEYTARLCVALEYANGDWLEQRNICVHTYEKRPSFDGSDDEFASRAETLSRTMRSYSRLVHQHLTRLEAVSPTGEFSTVHEMALMYIRGRLRAVDLEAEMATCELVSDVAGFQSAWLKSRRQSQQDADARAKLAAALWHVHLRHPDAFRQLVELSDPPRMRNLPPGLDAFRRRGRANETTRFGR
jgi:hypothetical protein